MSNLTEQDYDGFHAVLAELNATIDTRKKFHADQGYVDPESLSTLMDVHDDAVVYRTEIVPHLDELAQDEGGELRARAERAFAAFCESVYPGVHRDFNGLEDWQKSAWTKAAEALNG